MSNLSRRKLIMSGAAATAGVSGLAVAANLADRYGLIPPDHGGIYGPGETLTYACHRLLTKGTLAREFPASRISKTPFANGRPPKDEVFQRLEAGGFAGWRIAIDGLVTRPAAFSLAEIRGFPARSQITHLACEEGWSYIAQWTGAPLSHLLEIVGIRPQAKYVVYDSIQRGWSGSIDMADAMHPQTLITYGMNGADLPVGFGGPIRMRVPRQLGYKSVKYITRITVTDDPAKAWDKGDSYSWYAGI